MLAIATMLLTSFSKSPQLFIEVFTSDSDTIETIAFEIALSVPGRVRRTSKQFFPGNVQRGL